MHDLPEREFLELFDRISKKVNLRGPRSPDEINKRLKQVLKFQREMYLNAKNEKIARKWKGKRKMISTLYKGGFSDRVFTNAIRDPKSVYALTLKYGREKAIRIMRERSKAKNRTKKKKER